MRDSMKTIARSNILWYGLSLALLGALAFFGAIQERAGVFDRALTQEEITQIYQWRSNP